MASTSLPARDDARLRRALAAGADTPPTAPCDLAGHEALVADWLADLARRVAVGQRAEQTRAVYSRSIRPWLRFLATGARTDRPDPTTVEAFLAHAVGAGLAPATVNHLLATLASLYRFAERTGRYPHIARAAERLREARDGPLPCLDHEQVRALRSIADEAVAAAQSADDRASDDGRRRLLAALRDRAALSVLYGTGVRLVSLHRADAGDAALARGELRHCPKGHLAADAVAYLGNVAVADLRAYLDARAPLADDAPLLAAHSRAADGTRLSLRMLSAIMLRLLERGGHVARDPAGHVAEPRRLSAHSLRRSAARRIVEKHDLELARQLLGHASLETTRRAYARIRRGADLRKAADDLG